MILNFRDRPVCLSPESTVSWIESLSIGKSRFRKELIEQVRFVPTWTLFVFVWRAMKENIQWAKQNADRPWDQPSTVGLTPIYLFSTRAWRSSPYSQCQFTRYALMSHDAPLSNQLSELTDDAIQLRRLSNEFLEHFFLCFRFNGFIHRTQTHLSQRLIFEFPYVYWNSADRNPSFCLDNQTDNDSWRRTWRI